MGEPIVYCHPLTFSKVFSSETTLSIGLIFQNFLWLPWVVTSIVRLVYDFCVHFMMGHPKAQQKWCYHSNRDSLWRSNGPSRMTKMAATSIFSKNHLKIFFRTRRPMTLGLACSIVWGLPSLFK